MKTCRDAKRHFEKQLHDVKTNVEYQALLKSIATMERKIDEWEDVILESMVGEEELEKRVKSLEKDLAEKKKAVGELQSAFEAEKASAEKEIDACLRERDGYLEGLTGQVRSKYMRLMEAKGATQPMADESLRTLQRLVAANAVRCERDGQGRIVLPAELRQDGGLLRGQPAGEFPQRVDGELEGVR